MTDATNTAPGGWHPDPFTRHELRWWDGRQWTEHVSNRGITALDPPVASTAPASSGATAPATAATAAPHSGHTSDQVRHQVQVRAGAAATWTGGGHLLNEPILVVNQKAKFIELENEYAVYDQHGQHLGGVRQIGQTTGKKVLRALTSLDQFMTHRLQVVDAGGHVVLNITRPSKVMKSKLLVTDANDQEIGQIIQQNMIGKIRFSLEARGQTWGSINAENWRAWNFRLDDHTGHEIARITKTWEGLGRAMFTTADNYVVHIHQPLEDPLRALVVASAVSVDTALKQDAGGFN